MSTRNRAGLAVAGLALIGLAVWLFTADHPLRALPVVVAGVFCVLVAVLHGRIPSPLLAVPSIVIVAFIVTMVVGWRPSLGLDLQGGVSVVLKPVLQGGGDTSSIADEALDETKQIIERRINAFGVGEPDITRQGKTIVVQIPGIKDQQRALDLVGKTAELRFRPVLQVLAAPPTDADLAEIPALREKLKIPGDLAAVTVINDERAKRGEQLFGGDPSTTTTSTVAPTTSLDPNAAGAPTTAPAVSPPTVAPGGTAGPAISPASTSGGGGNRSATRALRARQGSASSTDVVSATSVQPGASSIPETSTTSTTTTTIDPTPVNQYGITVYKNPQGEFDDDLARLARLESSRDEAAKGLTPPELDLPEAEVTLAGREEKAGDGSTSVTRYQLGPSLLSGKSVETASAGLNAQDGKWEVRPTFREGAEGIDAFNAVATKCFGGDPTCPTKQLAIVLDGQVISAPSINNATFSRDQIQISGSFDEKDAKDLALALRYGSLPIQLEPQQIETVSATLGKGALRAGLIAGAVGLALVALYIVSYYRLLGLITISSLAMSAGTLWVVISILGEKAGLALTLSGIVGIIVSIGVSLDSSVVYFENLKEDVRNGRTVRSSIDRSFVGAFSTMVKADLSSLIGAVILYVITVGPVKGFAFYLGLSTVLDLTFTYYFLHPVAKMVVNGRYGTRPAMFGIPVDDVAVPAGTAPAAGGTP